MSWMNDRLPDMLWAALLVTQIPRDEALSIFRSLARFIHSLPESERFGDITHSGLASLSAETFEKAVSVIVASPAAEAALTPLCLFDNLPAQGAWNKLLAKTKPRLGWESLEQTVAKTLFHQSAEATDCRWIRVLAMAVAGKLVLPQGSETAKEILEYPNYGDPRKVRPSIRAAEGTVGSLSENNNNWPTQFWEECMRKTACFPLSTSMAPTTFAPATSEERLRELHNEIVKHCAATRTTTAVDSRHDTVFGMALYCVSILQELLSPRISLAVAARLILRTITECYINLAYLLLKESPELWRSYRAYGAGQAKLSFLKLEVSGDKPTSVDPQTLSELANEDAWQEFVAIDLGHWDKTDLRKMSEEAGVKEVYDNFYGWTSAYSHGQWSAIRDVVFDTCGNALHRLHRIPRPQPRLLPDAVRDGCYLVDGTLDLVSKAYPNLAIRLLANTDLASATAPI